MEERFEVRDHRNKSMFRVDDEYLNGYSKLCGVNATLVYLCLCRHADRNQESFPSIIGMSQKLGISRDSVMRGIKQLTAWNIISKKRERKTNAQWLNNTYVLLDKSVWVPKPSSTEQLGEPSRKSEVSQVANEGVAKSQLTASKVAHIEGSTYIKDAEQSSADVIEVIESFKEVNPSYKKYFANTTQRAAVKRMLDEHGKEKLLSIIAFLPKSNASRYAPTITTPVQLEDGLGKLFAWSQREKNKSNIAFA